MLKFDLFNSETNEFNNDFCWGWLYGLYGYDPGFGQVETGAIDKSQFFLQDSEISKAEILNKDTSSAFNEIAIDSSDLIR